MNATFSIIQCPCDTVKWCPKLFFHHTFCVVPIPEGSLPIRYLGVGVISARLRYEDCIQLMERTKQRIVSWSNRLLSFGGRALLIQ